MEPRSNLKLGDEVTAKPIEFSGDPLTLIGSYIKLPFVFDKRVEHMWIKVEKVNSETGSISGILSNDPLICCFLEYGDLIENRSLSEIEEILKVKEI